MLNTILAYSESTEFANQLLIYIVIALACFLISLYIFRAIFNIPSFLRYQRAQIRLLEELAKNQGVDATTVKSIISESEGWEASSQTTVSKTTV